MSALEQIRALEEELAEQAAVTRLYIGGEIMKAWWRLDDQGRAEGWITRSPQIPTNPVIGLREVVIDMTMDPNALEVEGPDGRVTLRWRPTP